MAPLAVAIPWDAPAGAGEAELRREAEAFYNSPACAPRKKAAKFSKSESPLYC
jgi:hypothetical protein